MVLLTDVSQDFLNFKKSLSNFYIINTFKLSAGIVRVFRSLMISEADERQLTFVAHFWCHLVVLKMSYLWAVDNGWKIYSHKTRQGFWLIVEWLMSRRSPVLSWEETPIDFGASGFKKKIKHLKIAAESSYYRTTTTTSERVITCIYSDLWDDVQFNSKSV